MQKEKSPHFCGGLCSRYLSSRAVTRQVLSAYMSLTSVFGMGSEPSAAGGRESEVNKWQGSVSDAAAPSARRAPGTPTGNRWTRPSFPQVQRIATPVCAPVRNDNGGVQTKKPPHFCGGLCSRYLSSRAVARQVLSAYMSLTSVFGMGTGGPS